MVLYARHLFLYFKHMVSLRGVIHYLYFDYRYDDAMNDAHVCMYGIGKCTGLLPKWATCHPSVMDKLQGDIPHHVRNARVVVDDHCSNHSFPPIPYCYCLVWSHTAN
jgi:hypothetical protein